MRFARIFTLCSLALALPVAAHACAVCAVLGSERVRRAIFNQTVFMSLLPLVVVGLGLWWFAHRYGSAWREDLQESPDAIVEPPAAPDRREP